jgi:8-oxo-dGTP pyrophosphatase MutT (NUDIX family)
MTEISVIPVDYLQLTYSPRPWPFASERRAEIDAHFATLKAKNPALWNGRVLLLHEFSIADGVFQGGFFETDFASFMAWRDWEFPGVAVKNCFAMAALRGSDGGFLLGVMGSHTANAGKIYFPCGTPEPADIAGDAIDFDGSVERELREETGILISECKAPPGWHAVLDGPYVALIKLVQASDSAANLRARILDHLAGEDLSELADIRIVRSPADFDPAMPAFVTAFLSYMWGQGGKA